MERDDLKELKTIKDRFMRSDLDNENFFARHGVITEATTQMKKSILSKLAEIKPEMEDKTRQEIADRIQQITPEYHVIISSSFDETKDSARKEYIGAELSDAEIDSLLMVGKSNLNTVISLMKETVEKESPQ